ncbi:hypothetical protein HSX37_05640|uniref:Uncharacterized protein n=1 Tax=Dendrosporobacter quercicolus TaxID=146817 RepID=A0A1G9P2W7_9FIRM|nr:hypothetical protein [Dendrosporobacter quercicolus]NSL47525.1 hypothetical protein [Dendrosporobacter quercicolus DSM 1736]SDL92893.1 hypothetical protein SAMN04488502_1011205 [Dendrosporobacter quercicolus]
MDSDTSAAVDKWEEYQKEHIIALESTTEKMQNIAEIQASTLQKMTQVIPDNSKEPSSAKLTPAMEKHIQDGFENLQKKIDEAIGGIFDGKQSVRQGFTQILQNTGNELGRVVMQVWLEDTILPVLKEWWQGRIKNWFGKEGGAEQKVDDAVSSAAASGTPATTTAVQKKQSAADKAKADKNPLDEAKLIEDGVERVNASIQGHMQNMLSGAESFRQSFMGIIKKLAQEFLVVTLQMWVTQQFPKWINKIFGIKQEQSGGEVRGQEAVIVGESGKELFVPHTSGTIVPNYQLNRSAASLAEPAVTINVVNNTGVQASARQGQINWDGRQYVVDIFLDAYARNVSGMRDIIGARG